MGIIVGYKGCVFPFQPLSPRTCVVDIVGNTVDNSFSVHDFSHLKTCKYDFIALLSVMSNIL